MKTQKSVFFLPLLVVKLHSAVVEAQVGSWYFTMTKQDYVPLYYRVLALESGVRLCSLPGATF